MAGLVHSLDIGEKQLFMNAACGLPGFVAIRLSAVSFNSLEWINRCLRTPVSGSSDYQINSGATEGHAQVRLALLVNGVAGRPLRTFEENSQFCALPSDHRDPDHLRYCLLPRAISQATQEKHNVRHRPSRRTRYLGLKKSSAASRS
jgi:hypothetical protein